LGSRSATRFAIRSSNPDMACKRVASVDRIATLV
jgi:hypothetical protein